MRGRAHALDDLGGVEASGDRVGVELVEVGHAQGEVGVREQFDRLGLGRTGQQHRDVIVQRALAQQTRELLAGRTAVTDDDAGGVQVIVQGMPLAQELGENTIVVPGCWLRFACVYPTGTVDFTTMCTSGFAVRAAAMTLSTDPVSKKFFSVS